MKDEEPIPTAKIQKTTRQHEPRTLLFLQIQSIVKYVGELLRKLLEHSIFLKLEVKGSADGWALVLLLEVR